MKFGTVGKLYVSVRKGRVEPVNGSNESVWLLGHVGRRFKTLVSQRNRSRPAWQWLPIADKIPSDSYIALDPKDTHGRKDVNGNTERPASVGLAHELRHADEAVTGKHNYDAVDIGAIGSTPPRERGVMKVELVVRAEHNIPASAGYYQD